MGSSAIDTCLITCEHGGNGIPQAYRHLFAGQEGILASHRGHDPGALELARELAAAMRSGIVFSTTSRLVVDLNRSRGHPRLFSEFTRRLSPDLRRAIVSELHAPYRDRVGSLVAAAVARGERVVHLSSHSFVPVLDGVVRTADVGLLYDPRRPGEAGLCAAWRQILSSLAPQLRVRRNYPYRGRGDGLTTSLRRRFDPDRYLGIELEVNHAAFLAGGPAWERLRGLLVRSFQTALDRCALPKRDSP